ncbi:MAG: YraN family protein [Actinobacteria bacterium]|uniref:UPF0102 protein GCM10009811_26710 n=1 Tax=Nostocoides veronense TaxID=330836 RepID=A0ABN2LWT1_9MICO|nr:YraN family protein [Actinomycetota bacterium]
MSDERLEVGRFGEEVAARYLHDRGFEILDRNWRTGQPRGELDIVARQGGGDLVIVEVKTRRNLVAGDPVGGVTAQKLVKLRRLAHAWLQANPQIRPPGVRFDVIGVLIGQGSTRTQVEHLRGVV